MTRVDLHCHSRHSAHPSEWFLQRIGASESYTDVEEVYRQAKQRGMTCVTLTDHNTIDGALELVERHPEDAFVSVELTTYFPEDGCKVHVLAYDITPKQFDLLQNARPDIYDLRDCLRENDIAHSVAHATYSVNGKLSRAALEKLLLLFNVFEAINGARGKFHNALWHDILKRLTPEDIERMHGIHGIEPWGPEPWIKGLTAGSDDHAGMFIGKAFTVVPDADRHSLAEAVKNRETGVAGRHGNHKALAFCIYKIAYEFSKSRAGANGNGGLFGLVNKFLFEEGRSGFKERLTVRRFKMGRDDKTRALGQFIEDISQSRTADGLDAEERFEAAYESLSRLTDAFFTSIATSLEKDLKNGHAERLLKNAFAAVPAIFMITPFFTTMRHLHYENRDLLEAFRSAMAWPPVQERRKLLWFSDTVTDLNGVAVTMRELATCAHRTGRPMKLVTSLPEGPESGALPPGTINLPCTYTCTPDFYTSFTLRLPSVLTSIDRIAAEEPTAIVVSTPGPVGLLGLTASRLLGIPCIGIYHTDFARQADCFIGDAGISSAIEVYTRWFFRQMDEVRVPTRQYIEILAERGLPRERMRLFRRGVQASFAVGDRSRQATLRKQLGIPDGRDVLLWAGRLGREKNLDFLAEIYEEVAGQRGNVALLLAGDGPERDRLASRFRGDGNVIFAGRVPREQLCHFYSLADVFVFPSTTDTFGMVVLEAQACGLPAIVTNVGGPQEIVRTGETGFVVPAADKHAWVAAVNGLLDMKRDDRKDFDAMRARTRDIFQTAYGWDKVLDDMLGRTHRKPASRTRGADRPHIEPAPAT